MRAEAGSGPENGAEEQGLERGCSRAVGGRVVRIASLAHVMAHH